jgi:L-fucose isomerase-like protein
MTHAEQHTMIVELMEYARRMKRYDQEEFDMFVKRDKDDEDLDELAQKKLAKLHEAYVVANQKKRL